MPSYKAFRFSAAAIVFCFLAALSHAATPSFQDILGTNNITNRVVGSMGNQKVMVSGERLQPGSANLTNWSGLPTNAILAAASNRVVVLPGANTTVTLGSTNGTNFYAVSSSAGGESNYNVSASVTNPTTFAIDNGRLGGTASNLLRTLRSGANIVITNEGTNLVIASTASGSGGSGSITFAQLYAPGLSQIGLSQTNDLVFSSGVSSNVFLQTDGGGNYLGFTNVDAGYYLVTAMLTHSADDTLASILMVITNGVNDTRFTAVDHIDVLGHTNTVSFSGVGYYPANTWFKLASFNDTTFDFTKALFGIVKLQGDGAGSGGGATNAVAKIQTNGVDVIASGATEINFISATGMVSGTTAIIGFPVDTSAVSNALTSLVYTIGANDTNYINSRAVALSNLSYAIGTAGTNFSLSASSSLYSAVSLLTSNDVRVVAGTGGITVDASGAGGVMTFTVNDDDAGGGSVDSITNRYDPANTFTNRGATRLEGAVTNLSAVGVGGSLYVGQWTVLAGNATNLLHTELTSLSVNDTAAFNDSATFNSSAVFNGVVTYTPRSVTAVSAGVGLVNGTLGNYFTNVATVNTNLLVELFVGQTLRLDLKSAPGVTVTLNQFPIGSYLNINTNGGSIPSIGTNGTTRVYITRLDSTTTNIQIFPPEFSVSFPTGTTTNFVTGEITVAGGSGATDSITNRYVGIQTNLGGVLQDSWTVLNGPTTNNSTLVQIGTMTFGDANGQGLTLEDDLVVNGLSTLSNSTHSGKVRFDEQEIVASTTNVHIDFALGENFYLKMLTNVTTITFTNVESGVFLSRLKVQQATNGPFTIANWRVSTGASVITNANANLVLTPSASAIDTFSLESHQGTNVMVTAAPSVQIATNDFVINTYYTNENRASWVTATIGLTNILAGDVSKIGLWLDQDADGTWEKNGISVRLNGVALGAGAEQISAFISPLGRFIFTNLSAGVSPSAAIEVNSSQFVKQ